MSKVKKLAEGGISSLGSILNVGISDGPYMPGSPLNPLNAPSFGGSIGGGGEGGGGAEAGLSQIDAGANTVRSAISSAQSALGGGGGNSYPSYIYKNGGSVKNSYTTKDGKLNLGSGRISTASKNKSTPNW
jgi:hypothetical protein